MKWFPVRTGILARTAGYLKAVNSVSFTVRKGEVLGLVGESGCGKSTLGRTMLNLIKPTSGRVFYEGVDITNPSRDQLRTLRRTMQIIFQDPYSSLNPRLTIGDTLGEVLQVHHITPSGKKTQQRTSELLEMVGLNTFHARRYPHEFSSGQRQRIGIARALAVDPSFIICDEPVSALDVSIQAQIINLLMDLRSALNLTYLFISHDLSVVRHFSDRVAVMYLGKIVEIGDVEEVVSSPRHPYTSALMNAAPVPNPDAERKELILGSDIPSPINIPSGCSFHPRCPEKFADCDHVLPRFTSVVEGHKISCLKYSQCYPDGDIPPETESVSHESGSNHAL